jgi:hypothetical protein
MLEPSIFFLLFLENVENQKGFETGLILVLTGFNWFLNWQSNITFNNDDRQAASNGADIFVFL